MSVETLRRAASLMRERAEAARAGHWRRAGTKVIAPRTWGYENVAQAEGSLPEGLVLNAEHIASWHPAVALAVADWLDDEADNLLPDTIADQIGLGATPEDAAAMAEILHFPALAVARAYLGEQP